MITVGVDLAAEPANTAVAVIDWSAGSVTAQHPADDDRIVDACADAERVGIDCPFGWPEPFVEFVQTHRAFGAPPPAGTVAQRREFAYRATDLWCRDEHKLRPLSVSADRIAHATFRCAGLLHRLGVRDRSGRDRVIEAYPAGALRLWDLYEPGYKSAPEPLAKKLLDLTGLRASRPLVSEHVVDAFVAALVARSAALGEVESPPPDLQELAEVEGWIVLPSGPVPRIAGI